MPRPNTVVSGQQNCEDVQFWQSTANVSVHPFRRALQAPAETLCRKFIGQVLRTAPN